MDYWTIHDLRKKLREFDNDPVIKIYKQLCKLAEVSDSYYHIYFQQWSQ